VGGTANPEGAADAGGSELVTQVTQAEQVEERPDAVVLFDGPGAQQAPPSVAAMLV